MTLLSRSRGHGVEIRSRIKAPAGNLPGSCVIPDCHRPTMRSSGIGLAEFHCRYHVQFHARHGSHWCPSIRAPELRPYLRIATQWIKERQAESVVSDAIAGLKCLLGGSGKLVPAQDIKRRSAKSRASVAFARLREAGVKPERLLAIQDDLGSHRVPEFRIVQIAKAVHRLASGTHRRWDLPLNDGSVAPIEFHAYPKSSGRVLRIIGGKIDDICSEVTQRDLQALRDAKLEKFGPHPSRLPGWRPLWARQRDAQTK